MYNSEELKALLLERALKFGDFTLASGRKAKYYCDGKQITLHSKGARLVGEGILEILKQEGVCPDAVGGMSIGADPIVASVITMADAQNLELKGFLVRKESKGHGTNKFVEGPVQSGDSAVILEDVVTTGGSSLLAIERAEAFGLKIKMVVAILDRMEGGREAFEKAGYIFKSLFTIRDFGLEPPKE
ncbi:MAG: orotate phosphoribosyltransferase [Planctomycetia bacterium]|nr:orotate phosphoribosyltransferase [Planctomycetia bacterium]